MQNLQTKHIWIIDDDQGILEVIQIILEEAGYVVKIINSGEEFDREIKNELPHLILLDILISGTNGKDIAKKIKTGERTRHIPVIMISANLHTAEIARDCGADDFLLKPFNIEDLEKMVKKYLKQS